MCLEGKVHPLTPVNAIPSQLERLEYATGHLPSLRGPLPRSVLPIKAYRPSNFGDAALSRGGERPVVSVMVRGTLTPPHQAVVLGCCRYKDNKLTSKDSCRKQVELNFWAH